MKFKEIIDVSYLVLSFNYNIIQNIFCILKYWKKKVIRFVEHKKKKKISNIEIQRNQINSDLLNRDESNVHFAKDLFFVCLIFISKQG